MPPGSLAAFGFAGRCLTAAGFRIGAAFIAGRQTSSLLLHFLANKSASFSRFRWGYSNFLLTTSGGFQPGFCCFSYSLSIEAPVLSRIVPTVAALVF